MATSDTTLPEAAPRTITTAHPIRLVLVGGFLGAGKTTALTALAQEFTARGLRVGIITNDQAAHLVDTATAREAGFSTAEVAGGCFCCRFTDLLDAAREVIGVVQPDVLLCEPVGSCTDMAATVIAPLQHFYPAQFPVAPFAVLVDPKRVRELVLGESPLPLAAEATYIFDKQLEEADEIVLNKTDRLDDAEAQRLAAALAHKYGKPVRPISALRGDGITAWADYLSGSTVVAPHLLREIDYDTYAAGEAVLGWLNATATLMGALDPQVFVRAVFTAVNTAEASAEIAHVKLALSDASGHFLRANLTATGEEPQIAGKSDWPEATTATLVVNARVQSTPEALEQVIRAALTQAAERTEVSVHIDTLQCFSPSYPRPPYRVTATKEL